MKTRRFKRYIVHYRSIVSSKGESYPGSIVNISEEGLAYIIPFFYKAEKDLIPEEKIKLNVLIPRGGTFNLNCEIRWTNTHCEHDNFCLGAKIIDPPAKYKEFLKTLD
jgi:hypothetical protein